MRLAVVEEDGIKVVEGSPDERSTSSAADTGGLIEACLSAGASSVLLHAQSITPTFFDLSSGEAGAVLQRLRNYGIRLAIVCAPGSVRLSSRFGDMVAEEQRELHFGLFKTRGAAREWLARGARR